MTAKEKAVTLCKAFSNELFIENERQYGRHHEPDNGKKMALICVDFLIAQNEKIIPCSIDINGQINPRWKYWQSVKEEIENLYNK